VRFWKKSKESLLRRGLQDCVLNGGSREELLREALAEVADGGKAHRIGIWLEPAEEDRKQEGVLRGTVWDSEIMVPAREWQWLAPQTVLPPASLFSGAAVEVDLTREVKLPIVGPLAGLGRAIWTPVRLAGKLRGVLLAGTRGIRAELPRERLLDVSGKLAVALALESERKASNERHADNALCERILARLQTNTPPGRLLQVVVESCLSQSVRPHNPGVAFAAIARIRRESSIPEQAGVAIEFLCTAGKVDENQITAHEAVNMLVREALEGGCTSGAEIRSLSGEEFLRVIAIPLHVRGKRQNILLAGFHPAQAFLSSLERLELRGTLAASVLEVMEEAETEASNEQHKAQEVAPPPTAVPDGAKEKRAEAELVSLAEWLEQGVILYDEHENVGLLNLRFAQMAGIEQEELEGSKTLEGLIERLKGRSANPEVFAQRWRHLAKREIGGEREEVNLVRPVARVLERASRPVLDSEGKQIGRIELYKDLTAQRVFQAKLLQTERLAALGQMVSGVAHELSNPLTSILGYAQRLLLRNDAEGNYEEIRKIFGEAERAGAILRRMLLAARETTPERKLVSLNQIVQKTIDFHRFSLAAERIRVDVCLDATLPKVLDDAGQLQQVLINLLGNALQAIESQGHGGTIRVRTQRTDDKHARLEVSDSGPGIPEGIMARIFDPFFHDKAGRRWDRPRPFDRVELGTRARGTGLCLEPARRRRDFCGRASFGTTARENGPRRSAVCTRTIRTELRDGKYYTSKKTCRNTPRAGHRRRTDGCAADFRRAAR
jgi:signal transduction histidine kinase